MAVIAPLRRWSKVIIWVVRSLLAWEQIQVFSIVVILLAVRRGIRIFI